MIKYGKVIDTETGLCEVALGTDIEYYINQRGYTELEVCQSDIDFNWYLAEKCKMKSEEDKIRDRDIARIEEIKESLSKIDEQRIRAIAEPSVKDEATGETWLEHYNTLVGLLRAELKALEAKIEAAG